MCKGNPQGTLSRPAVIIHAAAGLHGLRVDHITKLFFTLNAINSCPYGDFFNAFTSRRKER